MIKSILIIILISSINIPEIFSQDSTAKFIITDNKNKNDSALSPFWEEQSEWFRNPEIPSFVFQSPGRKFSLGIGGFINLTTSHDFDGISDNLDFVTYDIDVPQISYEKQQFQMYANTSLIFFKVIQKISKENLVGYISANFRGEGSTFSLFQAYVKYYGIEFGQDWSTFTDVASWPTTVNYLALNSMPEVLNPLLRYSNKFAKGWQFALSMELPEFVTDYENTLTLKQKVPDIPAYLQYNFGSSHIRLSGIYRNLLYRDTVSDQNESVTGAGISLTGDVAVSKKLQIYFQGLYGQGLGQYVDDLSIDELNVFPDSDQPGLLKALPVYAYYGALQYNFNADLFTTVMYSQVKVQPDNFPDPDFYSYAIQFTGNVFWNFIPPAQLGLEYCFGKRVNQNGAYSSANRGEVMFQYNF